MPELKTGLVGTTEWTVTDTMTAAQVGSGLVAAFSTPMLVALLESAAVNALEGTLEPDDTSVGTRIDVQHLAATPVGGHVRAQATLTTLEGRKLTFTVEAWDDAELIGTATHERFVVNKDRFGQRLKAKQDIAD